MGRVHWKGGMAGVEGDFDEGLTSKTCTAAAVTNLGDGLVRIPVSHAGDFIANDYVVINGTDYYDGNHRIVNVDSSSDIDIEHTYVDETLAVTDTVKSSNWQDEFGVPVAAPVAADDIIFDSSAGIATDVSDAHEEGKHWNLIGNIAQADTGELEVGSITVKSSFTGKIGIDAHNTVSPFHISVADNGYILYQGNGDAAIECSADDSVTDINIPLCIFDSASGYLRLSSDMNSASWTSSWDLVKCLNAGTLELADNTVVTTMRTLNSLVKLIIGTGCVDVKDSNAEMDLYLSDDTIPAGTAIQAKVECDGAINFGTSALTLTKSY